MTNVKKKYNSYDDNGTVVNRNVFNQLKNIILDQYISLVFTDNLWVTLDCFLIILFISFNAYKRLKLWDIKKNMHQYTQTLNN